MANVSMFTLLFNCCLCFIIVSASANITTTEFLRDSGTLSSSDATFKIGFFSVGNSTNRYVGIWYNTEDPGMAVVVWVANRNNPISDSSGVLKISEDGNLQLLDGSNTIFWSSNVSHQANSTSVAQLLDTGNLVLLSSASGMAVWQSFEHLTDVLLPQTNIITNLSIGNGMDETPIMQSWKNSTDPSVGRFRVGLVPNPITELITRDGDEIFWRSGPWDGSQFLGMPKGYRETFRIIYNDQEHSLNTIYSVSNKTLLEFYMLNIYGYISLHYWDDGSRKWDIGWQSIMTDCDYYGKCGPFGHCHPGESPICSCLDGFKPMNNDEWSEDNWTSGCVRQTPLQCDNTGGKEDEFFKLEHVKLPHYINFENLAADQDNCRMTCLKTCLCLAYAYHDGIGCMTWTENLMDVQVLYAGGVDLFIRLANSEVPEPGKTSNMKIIIAVTVPVVTITFVVFMYCMWSLVYRSRYGRKNTNTEAFDSYVDQVEFKDLTLFKFKDLEVATNNFSEMNKLGRGGFGPVYKGNSDGQEIAVKRLSRSSGQGPEEFMNEVLVISKLQHKNLVKLLGCCVEREEKLLVYEYMPNKSLDALLFDSQHGIQLDWKKRFNIINGICRGLLYLHRDSRLKIIHRDLKADNILIDEDLNPKISDFGMARIFETKQDQANTLRVVGTYGYMSPEYAMEGLFSEKSDVFSLGVLLLEIVSGRKNSSFMNIESMSLLTYAWKLWTENDMPSLIDPTILDPCFNGEILKCIQLGLLCVQEFPEDRPTISTLISMLDVDDIMDLPHPTQPGFTHRKVYSTDEILLSSQDYGGSVNNVSLTAISGR